MPTFVCDSLEVHVPRGIVDLESFRRWAEADDFPENARLWFLKGEVWVDTSREQPLTCGAVKTEITAVLAGLVKGEQKGRYWGAGVFVSNVPAMFAGKPSGTNGWLKSEVFGRSFRLTQESNGFGHPEYTVEVR
jgi:hypothetical protein